jgi:hypothetical protein
MQAVRWFDDWFYLKIQRCLILLTASDWAGAPII